MWSCSFCVSARAASGSGPRVRLQAVSSCSRTRAQACSWEAIVATPATLGREPVEGTSFRLAKSRS